LNQHCVRAAESWQREGAAQCVLPEHNNDIHLGAVGVLQFDVVGQSLKEEYQGRVCLRGINVWSARWIECSGREEAQGFTDRPIAGTWLSTAGTP